MFDPDFCGAWILSVAVCFLQLFFSHDYDFSSPQNRFKGPKVVRFPSLRNSRSEKKTHLKGVFFILVAGVGLEPHDLRVMSPMSYQLLHPAIWCRKPGSNRYEIKSHGILSPGRLPIPPFRHIRLVGLLLRLYIISLIV